MAENDLDSGSSNGTPATPITGGSDGKGDSGGSFDALKLQSTLEALTKKLDEVDERSKALQGDKDRGVTKTKKEVDELKRKIAEIAKLKKSGLGEDDAIEELSFRDELRTVRELLQNNSVQTQPAGNGTSKAFDVAQVVTDYALDGNDPEVISQVISKNFTDERDARLAAANLAFRRANPTPQTIGAVTALTGAAPVSKLSDQEADVKYGELNRLLREPTLNSSKIKQLKKELADSGYET